MHARTICAMIGSMVSTSDFSNNEEAPLENDGSVEETSPSEAEKPTKKRAGTRKKSPAKAKEDQPEADPDKDELVVVKMLSGASYRVNGVEFTRDNPYRGVSPEWAEALVSNGRFAVASKDEVHEFYKASDK